MAKNSLSKEDAEIERKVNALLKKMTIEEKAGQVNETWVFAEGFDKYITSKTGLGFLVDEPIDNPTPEHQAQLNNERQKLAVEKSRLGIPLIISCDNANDAKIPSATTFPQDVGMGSTWDDALVERCYVAMGKEIRSIGETRLLAPDIGIGRDPRFGRTGECFSEDPYLTSRMAAASVRGLKGESFKTGVLATIKHYTAYDASMGGKDSSQMDISERTLREVWIPPYKAAVDAGAGSVMCAYHAINGVPAAANKFLLTDILKNELGFEGFIVTDFVCIEALKDNHHVAASFDEAIKMALEAGMDLHDLDMGDDYASRLAGLVRKGYISEKVLDEAVRRVLRMKYRLGLFDNPYVDPENAKKIVGCEEHRQVELQAARESMVLLKNDGGILPLRKDLKSIAVIGPNADNIRNQLGVWVKVEGPGAQGVNVLQGIRNHVSKQTEIRYVKGCEILNSYKPIPEDILAAAGANGQEHGLKGEYFSSKDFSGKPILVRTDKTFDFDWGRDRSALGVETDNFSVRWTGKIIPPVTGRYRLCAESGAGICIFLNGDRILDKWTAQYGAHTVAMDLDSRYQYDLRIECRQTGGDAKIKLSMNLPTDGTEGIADAVKAAKASDVAILVLGDCPELNSETKDRADLSLPGHQSELLKAVYETGTPTVVVMVNARPYTINWMVQHIPAILEAWNPGQEGGEAVGEVLFGDYNPGGKLTITFPRHEGQLPMFYDYEPGWHGEQYCCDTPMTPLYPFGYGLSYTTFEYGEPRLSSAKMSVDGKVEVSVDVTNTGTRKGDEVVQLYIHDPIASVVRPIKELKGFKRITLDPGQKKTVTIPLTADDLAFYNVEMKRVVEPGTIEVTIGGNSVDVQTVNLEVTSP